MHSCSDVGYLACRPQTPGPLVVGDSFLLSKPKSFDFSGHSFCIGAGIAVASYPGPHITVFPLEGLVTIVCACAYLRQRVIRKLWFMTKSYIIETET